MNPIIFLVIGLFALIIAAWIIFRWFYKSSVSKGRFWCIILAPFLWIPGALGSGTMIVTPLDIPNWVQYRLDFCLYIIVITLMSLLISALLVRAIKVDPKLVEADKYVPADEGTNDNNLASYRRIFWKMGKRL